MALPPTIPTSFVPRQPTDALRPKSSGKNMFLIISLAILGVMVLASGGIFAYARYLTAKSADEDAQLLDAQKRINDSTVQGFVDLTNRLMGARSLLDRHVTLSKFFDFLEQDTLQTVHYSGLSIVVANDRTATVQMSGQAKTFNSLAAQSSEIAQDPRIKHAIFSGFSQNKDGTVKFTLTFDLDKSLVVLPPASAADTSVGAAAPTTVVSGAETGTTSPDAMTATATSSAATTTQKAATAKTTTSTKKP